jgi:trehalose/maltose hydrolase-like predicted phosphorylase
MEALSSDYVDIQGGTTGEGIHAGVMGSTLLFVLQSIAGIQFHREMLTVDPQMPRGWKKIQFGFAFRKNYYTFEIFCNKMEIQVENTEGQPVEIEIPGKVIRMNPGEKVEAIYSYNNN